MFFSDQQTMSDNTKIQKITDDVSSEWISWIKEVKSNNINILVIHEIGTGGSIVQIIKLESFTILPLRKSFMRYCISYIVKYYKFYFTHLITFVLKLKFQSEVNFHNNVIRFYITNSCQQV
jgi:hypothetical protein